MVIINPKGYWESPLNIGHGVDVKLAKAITTMLLEYGLSLDRFPKVLDLGCGNGYYTNFLNAFGIETIGVDGNPFTGDLGSNFIVHDLTELRKFGDFDFVLSLEVGEHIPEEFENIFISNININTIDGVILSWSVPSFGGDGHVNPKTNDYVVERFKQKGFKLDEDAQFTLRNSATSYPNTGWWFKDTLMVFRKLQHCPYCPDAGWYANLELKESPIWNENGEQIDSVLYTEASQVQCEFCYTNPLSYFNNKEK